MSSVFSAYPVDMPLLVEPYRSLGRRVLDMTLLWTFFGVVMGIGLGIMEGFFLGVVAHVLAALLVMPVLGVVFGLIGGPWREAFVGGVCGALIGLAGGFLTGAADVVLKGYVCLIIGTMIGATFLEMGRRVKQALAALRRAGQRG